VLDIDAEAAEGVAVLRLSGELDLVTAPDLVAAVVAAAVEGTAQHVTVDLGGVDLVDSSGLAAFVRSYRLVTARDGTLSVRGAAPHIRKMFSITGVDQVITLEG
jgi:anti-sigma B factor antagonist